MAIERKSPPMIINTPEDGFLRVGLTTAPTSRPDQVQLAGGCGTSLRIFEDGGWELRSVNKPGKENKKGCNIIARGPGGLHILSEGDINIDARARMRITARQFLLVDAPCGMQILSKIIQGVSAATDRPTSYLSTGG